MDTYKLTAVIKADNLLDAWGKIAYLPATLGVSDAEEAWEAGVVGFSLENMVNKRELLTWSSEEDL